LTSKADASGLTTINNLKS